jgi:4-diphosphocytidyl-2-C-methyl-D-erythritol kinase
MPRRSHFDNVSRDSLTVWAPAKINLNLLVGPRREDGYHPLDSLICQVTLYDRLDLTVTRDGTISLHCHGADCGPDDRNLAVRAARALAGLPAAAGFGVSIRLSKSIPAGAGLGGGSSDAAAVLEGLNRLWRLGLPQAQLASIGASLGSDVPLFLGPTCARMTGRGEIIQPAAVHGFVCVLILPPCACPTAAVYQAFDRQPTPMPRQLEPELLLGPPSRWRGLLVNQLGPAARAVSPQLAELWDSLSSRSDVPILLTGSGSALFALCDNAAEAATVAAVADGPCRVVLVEPAGRE